MTLVFDCFVGIRLELWYIVYENLLLMAYFVINFLGQFKRICLSIHTYIIKPSNVFCILGLAASVWLMIRLQMIGVAMVTMVSFLAVIEHHINSIDPGRLFSCWFARSFNSHMLVSRV